MDETGDVCHTVYCDMESEPRSAWTLVQSFAFKNKSIPELTGTPLRFDASISSGTPNWNAYRMSHSQMSALKTQSTHWRITCDLQSIDPIDLHRDYALASFENFDAMTLDDHGVCMLMKYVNVRGHHCSNCTAAWWSHFKASLHLDSSSAKGCQFDASQGSVSSEDNFGLYSNTNSNFRCTSYPDATTNIWFGGYY